MTRIKLNLYQEGQWDIFLRNTFLVVIIVIMLRNNWNYKDYQKWLNMIMTSGWKVCLYGRSLGPIVSLMARAEKAHKVWSIVMLLYTLILMTKCIINSYHHVVSPIRSITRKFYAIYVKQSEESVWICGETIHGNCTTMHLPTFRCIFGNTSSSILVGYFLF